MTEDGKTNEQETLDGMRMLVLVLLAAAVVFGGLFWLGGCLGFAL